MQIKKQFNRQNIIYIFNIIAPVIIWLEALLYMQIKVGKIEGFLLYILGSMVCVTTAVMLLIHIITNILFWKRLSRVIEKNTDYKDENLKIGRILVNADFILDYGIFRKRIIPIAEIFCVKNRKEIVSSGNRRVAYHVNRIVLLRKGAREIKLYAPTDFLCEESKLVVKAINNAIEGKSIYRENERLGRKYPCDFPFYSFLGICIIPVMGVLIWLYPYIRDLLVDHQDKIKTFLFCVSYEEIVRRIIVILLYLFFIGMFTWKHYFMRIDLGSLKTFFALVAIICFTPFVQFALPWDFAQYCEEYKEDYKAYQSGNYEIIEVELYDIGEASEGSCFEKASEIVERYDMYVRNVRCPDYNYFGNTLHLINNDISISEGSTYKVKYLKNSGIIIEIQEVE